MRAVVCLVAVAVLVGCESVGQPSSQSSAVSASVLPSPSATIAPSQSKPGPTVAGCTAVSPAVEYLPDVGLHLASDPEQFSVHGLNGRRTAGAEAEPIDWRQPPPGEALIAVAGEGLLVRAFIEDVPTPPCLQSVSVAAAPFSPLAITPAAPVALGSTPASPTLAREFSFGAPAEPGEWIVRVTLAFGTSPNETSRSTYFRLRVDVPPPRVDGTATAPVDCVRPGARQPGAFLSVDGGERIRGDGGGFTWRGTSAQGGPEVGPPIEVEDGARLRIAIGDDVCAAWWRIQVAPTPASMWGPFEAITDLVPDSLSAYYDVPPGAANRFKLADVPPGDWVLEAHLWFAESRDNVIGQTWSIWHVVVR